MLDLSGETTLIFPLPVEITLWHRFPGDPPYFLKQSNYLFNKFYDGNFGKNVFSTFVKRALIRLPHSCFSFGEIRVSDRRDITLFTVTNREIITKHFSVLLI